MIWLMEILKIWQEEQLLINSQDIKHFFIAKNPKYDEYQKGLASTAYKLFDKDSKGGSVNNEIKQNKQLAEELHKPIIKKLK